MWAENNNSINIVNKEVVKPNEKWKQEMQVQFPDRFQSRGRRTKHHKIHARVYEGTVVKQQKGVRVPIQLQESVKKEINRKALQESHIVKVVEIKEDVFLQPTVITVKKSRSVKIRLDARELMKIVVKDKYPKPNLDNLMDMIAENVTHGTDEEHIEKVKEVLQILDEANIKVKLDNWKIASVNFEWVGYKLSQQGVETINSNSKESQNV